MYSVGVPSIDLIQFVPIIGLVHTRTVLAVSDLRRHIDVSLPPSLSTLCVCPVVHVACLPA